MPREKNSALQSASSVAVDLEFQGQGHSPRSHETSVCFYTRSATKLRILKMTEQRRTHLNRSMEKSFEDLLTGLDDDLEPDIDDIFTNYDHLPEKVTDSTFNAMAFQHKDTHLSPASSLEKEFPKMAEPASEESKKNDLKDIQFPRAERNTDPGIQSEDEDEELELHEELPEELEFVSSHRQEEEEGEVYDSSKLILPTFGESNTDDSLLGNVELEEDEEDEEEEEKMEHQKQTMEGEDQKDLTMFSGLDHDDSDPDIDKLVAECEFLPETVTDSTINAMVDRNRPLAKSYHQSQELDNEESDRDETMEIDATQENSPPPEVRIRIQKEASLDFSVLEPDSNHLDVDIGKHKTNLRKQGSLAKRRKPTRSNVRSALLSGEEAMFQDSSEPKREPADSKEDEDDVFGQRTSTSSTEGVPTSPPAKKPSKVMVPLPGFGGPKPELRRRSEEQHQADMAVDEPKKKDFRSYGVKLPVPQVSRKSESTDETISTAALRKVPRKDDAENQEPVKHYNVSSLKSVKKESRVSKTESESDKFFEKPSLRQVSRSENKERTSGENKFEKPALKTVSRPNMDKSNEVDVKFEIPALKQVTLERGEINKSDKENESLYSRPSLKSTPKPPEEKAAPTTPKSPEAKTFELPTLRPTPKASRSRQEDTQQDAVSFEKPALRNVSRPLERKESVETGSFEKPTLRNVGKPPLPEKRISIAEDDSEDKHKFDVPALRMVPRDQKPTETLRNVTRGEKGSEIELIRKPSLKSTPRKEVPKSEEGKETPGWLKNMKLRKTKSQSEDINNVEESKEQPEWLQTASEKREKALETLNSKENISKTSSENKVPWLSRDNLKKTSTPLQENNDNLHSNNEEGRQRLSSVESNGDIDHRSRERTPSKNDGQKANYVPSWMKAQDSRHKSNPNLNFVTPASNSEELPDWKKALAEKRKSRRDSDIIVKPTADSEKEIPPWKQELAKKGMKSSTPVKPSSEQRKSEPEWKLKADEKRQRIIIHFKTDPDDEEQRLDSSTKP
ncbi:neurofilament heavy polypeptide-like isoform X6 [Ostrea edulis]|uniref:neurofilament heavy polypeptide-like isoform X6 n=1 Tax=Ostrea edulis TaxID=37623 RepID=UPI0024AF5E7D|nr:neurofilament heavy polypeptide-like isoform X6 [Ostrea edulis]XP_048752055.2 neurofilament heavy polypeptide-like isoform X6 [Ostrea edulis]XP_048752056.2 neurofilament heavy polypeptide-like isoform X6 [Ostrea edulis]XP_056009069.1 neurofilament heavy polypeptide-like isoform X6 [Ostrea edulis]